jgi:hypothetical protein
MSTPESREEEIEEDPMEDDPEVIQALNQAKQVPRTPQDVWDNLRKCDEPGMNTRDTVSSIEIFRQSLPELDNRAFDRMIGWPSSELTLACWGMSVAGERTGIRSSIVWRPNRSVVMEPRPSQARDPRNYNVLQITFAVKCARNWLPINSLQCR